MGLWRVLSDLEEEGYRCAWGIFSAEEVGAPHQRKRVFILAKLPDTNLTGLEGETSERVQGREGRGEQYEVCESTRRGGQNIQKQLGNPASKRPHRGSENCEGEQSEVLGERLESDEELANPTSRQPRQSQAWNGGQDTSGGSEEELAHSNCDEQTKERGDDGEVLEVSQVEGQELSPTLLGGESTQGATQWPARPGEEQYAWEEPRVTKTQSKLGGESHARQRHDRVDATTEGVDAIVNRVDRLRLLGNGVVPQTAELAWRTLWKEINKYE